MIGAISFYVEEGKAELVQIFRGEPVGTPRRINLRKLYHVKCPLEEGGFSLSIQASRGQSNLSLVVEGKFLPVFSLRDEGMVVLQGGRVRLVDLAWAPHCYMAGLLVNTGLLKYGLVRHLVARNLLDATE